MNRRSVCMESGNTDDLIAEFQQATNSFMPSNNQMQHMLQQYGQYAQISELSQMEFRPPPVYSQPPRAHYGIPQNYPAGFSDRQQQQGMPPPQQYGQDQFYPPACPPQAHHQNPQHLSMQSPTPPLPVRQRSPQLSPLHRVQRQSPQLSPVPVVRVQNPQNSPRHRSVHQNSQLASNQNSQGPNSQSLNVPMSVMQQHGGEQVSGPGFSFPTSHCLQRNDPPLGNMHMAQSNLNSSVHSVPFSSAECMVPDAHNNSVMGLTGRKICTISDNSSFSYGLTMQANYQRSDKPLNMNQNVSADYSGPSYFPQPLPSSSLLQHLHRQNGSIQAKSQSNQHSVQSTMRSSQSSIESAAPMNYTVHNILSRKDNPTSRNPSYQTGQRSSIGGGNQGRGTVPAEKSKARGGPAHPGVSRYERNPNSSGNVIVNSSGSNPYSVFSLVSDDSFPTRAMRSDRGRGPVSRGSARGRGGTLGRGRGKQANVQLDSNEITPVQWYKCPEALSASSFQSDIEAMQANVILESHVKKITVQGRPTRSPVPKESGKKQTANPRDSANHSSITPNQTVSQKQSDCSRSSASKAAALAAIQIKQEMVENIRKPNNVSNGDTVNSSANTTHIVPTNLAKNQVRRKTIPTVENEFLSRADVSRTSVDSENRRNSVPNTHSACSTKDNFLDCVPSVPSNVTQPDIDLQRSKKDNSMQGLPSMPSAPKLKPNNSQPKPTAVENHIATSGCPPAPNMPQQHRQGKSLPERQTNSLAQLRTPTHNLTKANQYDTVISSQNANNMLDKKALSAREKVFCLWKSGQVVGRSPVCKKAGLGRGKGKENATEIRAVTETANSGDSTSNTGSVAEAVGTPVGKNSPRKEIVRIKTERACDKPVDSNQLSGELCYIMLHGHKLICLKSTYVPSLILCQFQFECFPDKGMGSVNNCIDRALRIKKGLLNHPISEKISSFLKNNGYNIDGAVHIINLDDARRVYHFMYKITNCSNESCVVELSNQPVDLNLKTSPGKKRTLTREIIMRVKKEKKTADDKSYGRLSSVMGNDHLLSRTTDQSNLHSELSVTIPRSNSHSPASGHTVAYGMDRDSDDPNDLILVEASEDPHVIRWSGDAPKTGGLCNTIVGQCRSYKHKSENFLVVEDLCRIFGTAAFYDGVEKENIILYTCCKEIMGFLNAISVKFPPLSSLCQSLVKEKDVGVHITDDAYVPANSDTGSLNIHQLKRPICKQEIIDDQCSSPKQARFSGGDGDNLSSEMSSYTGGNVNMSPEGSVSMQINTSASLSSAPSQIITPATDDSFEKNCSSSNQSDRHVVSNKFATTGKQGTGKEPVKDCQISPGNVILGTPNKMRASMLSQPNKSQNFGSDTRTTANQAVDIDTDEQLVEGHTSNVQGVNISAMSRQGLTSSPESYSSSLSQEAQASPAVLRDQEISDQNSCTSPTGENSAGRENNTIMRKEELQARTLWSDNNAEKLSQIPSQNEGHTEEKNTHSASVLTSGQQDNVETLPGHASNVAQRCHRLLSTESLREQGLKLKSMLLKTKKNQGVTYPPASKNCPTDLGPPNNNRSELSEDQTNSNVTAGRDPLTVTLNVENEAEMSSRRAADEADLKQNSTAILNKSPSMISSHASDSSESSDANKKENRVCAIPSSNYISTPDGVVIEISDTDAVVPDYSNIVLVSGFRVKVVDKVEAEDPSYDKAAGKNLLISQEMLPVSSGEKLDHCYLPPISSLSSSNQTSTSSESFQKESSAAASLPLRQRLCSDRFRSMDDMDIMDTSSTDPLAAATSTPCDSKKSVLLANAKLCKQNKALLDIVSILRKQLSVTKAELTSTKADLAATKSGKEKAEKVSKYYESVIQDITASFKNGDEEEPILIEDNDCSSCQVRSLPSKLFSSPLRSI